MKQLILITFLLFSYSIGYCCSCMDELSVKEEFKHADVVIIGKVIAKKLVYLPDTLREEIKIPIMEYILEVETRFKGEIGQKELTIFTGTGRSDCGVIFEEGQKYIVYSYFRDTYPTGKKVPRFLYTHICTRTGLANDRKEQRKLRRLANRL
ncbi:hypothetical protein [Chitinophaga sp. sic0106]|uniref:hypothetical protein n=1 Tax=Chitinophaga sp. sic0106 TaxID=2854785 RepID=UPI001C454B53|nr:hypothetical protein [Chitinophaga sp. sic0106]MBV7529316.1 hypothetical protein [Chitinophaga sp. sic0106]